MSALRRARHSRRQGHVHGGPAARRGGSVLGALRAQCRSLHHYCRRWFDENIDIDGGGRRQHVTLARRRWRRQHGEFARPRRQEKYRRRWRRPETRAGEDQHRTVDIDQFLRRRGRNAEVDHDKARRRLHLRAQQRQASARIPNMRTIRVAAQIRPIGRRRVVHHAMTPRDLLAAHREHRRDALRIGTVRIDREELLIGVDRVECDGCGIGVVWTTEVAQAPVADVGQRQHVRRRRRIGGPLGEEERPVDL